MAHFALLWKARTIEKYRLNYERKKLNSIRISSTDDKEQTLYQKWKYHKFIVKHQLTKSLQKLYPEGSKVHHCCMFVRTDQESCNLVLKGVIGFVVGMFLTYLCFMFFVFQLSLSLIHATIMSSIIGVLLTMGLAFSLRIRCLVFLLIPQLFSRVGRYTLTCYALVLILTGPATNTLKNLEILTESMACGQEQIKTSVHQLNESIKKPFNAMTDSVKLIIDRVRRIAVKLKTTVLKINRLVLNIVNVLQSSFAWLTSVPRICNRKLGVPYQHCTKSLHGAKKGCQAYFGPQFAWLCNMDYVANVTCWTMKSIKPFCGTVEFMNKIILGAVIRKLKTFTNRVKLMIYVDINIHHSYSISTNTSGSASQVAAGIVTEIRNRADTLLTWLSWSSCITSLFLLLVLFRAKYYQHMFETRSRFDNRFVTKELRDLDFKRLRQGRETVLPLNRRENCKYITTTSFRLVSSERVHLSRSAVFMVITTFKLMIHIVADYSLYWVLMTIRYHGKSQIQKPPPTFEAYIPDSGLVARIFKDLLESFTVPVLESGPATVQCLPDPNVPDLQRYTQIGILIFLLWFFALFEPYGLRLRHVIMGSYRPERAKARAFWLFNHIQRTRASFMKLARRKLHRECKYLTEEKYTFRNWVNSHLPCSCLQYLLGTRPSDNKCVLCGTIGYPNNPVSRLIRCNIPKCPGIYCSCCFSDIGEMCTVCLSPADYGDLSDISLEKGSSAESSDSEHDSNIYPNDYSAGICMDASYLNETDDNDNSVHSTKPNKNNKWNLFENNSKKESQEHIPLLDYTGEVQKELHKSGSLRSKAMMVRHNKFYRNACDTFLAYSENITDIYIDLKNTVFCQHCQFQVNICEKSTKAKPKIVVQKACRSIVRRENGDLCIFRKRKKYKTSWNPSKLVMCVVNYFKKFRAYTTIRKSKTSGNTRTYKLKRKLFRNIALQVKNHPVLKCYLLKKRRKRKTRKDVKRIRSDLMLGPFKRNNSGEVHRIPRNNKKTATTSEMVRAAKMTKETKVQKLDNSNKMCNKDVTIAVCCDNSNPNSKPFTVKTEVQQSRKADYRGEAEDTSDDSESNNKICYKIENFRNLVSNYLTTSKLGILSSNTKRFSSYFRISDVSLNHEKTNHKRRKKDIVNEYCVTGKKIGESKKEDTRKYRISTYLLDQDWIKRRYNKNKTLVVEQNDKLNPTFTKSNKEDLVDIVIKNDTENADKCKVQSVEQKFIYNNIYTRQQNRPHPSRTLNFDRSLEKGVMDNLNNEFIFEHKQEHKNHPSVQDKMEPSTGKDHKVSHHGTTQPNPKQNFKIHFNESYLPVASASNSCNQSNLSSSVKKTKVFSKNRDDASTLAKGAADKPNKFWTPLSLVKYLLLCHMFVKSKKMDITCKARTFSTQPFQRHSKPNLSLKTVTQPPEYVHDAEKFCTCATQYCDFGKDGSTNFKNNVNNRHNQPNCKVASTVLKRDNNFKDISTMHYNCYTTTQSCAIQCNQYSKVIYNHESSKFDKFKRVSPLHKRERIICSTDTFTSSSKGDEGTKTDTTICSLATFDYLDEIPKKNFSYKRPKVNVVTKANQSTSTDTKMFCNASTLTSDWWSPIVERKEMHKIVLEKKEGKYLMKDDKRNRDAKGNKRSILTEGKVVKFRSHAQIIPMGSDDILSPSRYLLESQKYYNELFSPHTTTTPHHAPHVFPVNSVKKNPTKIEYKWTAETGKLDHMRLFSRNKPNCVKPKCIFSDISLACHCPSNGSTGSL